ncbi:MULTISPECIES: hypothetical protein [Aneurinibacillus]|jgi:hypothetical protein|uniref:Uncharacterized protein n=1 Tax=Aneurinibacillus danicus TaxID=267746 RepID=A0A511V9Z2_9BACL|nr:MULTISPECIES: hypothetical protein [Aneurinibacillus]GEN35737.1 hypothetical protein ADA01nite_31970 [Aneurinibacillus danicus]
MGEFLFSIGYGGSLIVIGLFTRAFLQKMEQQATKEMDEVENSEGAGKTTSYGKVGI